MAKVRLYEDIDGCLNAPWNALKWRREDDTGDQVGYQRGWVHPEYNDFGERTGPSGLKYRMEWNDRLVDALNSLDVEFVWTTTWRTDALKVGELMKLSHSPLRVLHPLSGETRHPSIHWKYDAILKDQENSPSPFIAVDDEWNNVHPDIWKSLTAMGGLVISPIYNFGITPDHIEQMRAYIEKHT